MKAISSLLKLKRSSRYVKYHLRSNYVKQCGYFLVLSTEFSLNQVTLKQWQEDNKLFVERNASKEVERLLDSQNMVIVTGHPGSGKSEIVHHVALKLRKQGWNVKVIHTVRVMIQIINSFTRGLNDKTIFVLNDPIGKDSFDEIEYTIWRKYEESLKVCLKKIKLLMSCRKYILSDDKVKGLLKNESTIVDITCNQFKLSYEEKEKIWRKHALDEDVSKEELKQIVQTETYFPLLCKLYVHHKINKKEKLRFFKAPVELFEEELRNFRESCKEKYCALILLVLFNNKFCVKDIRGSVISRNKYEFALEVCEMKKDTSTYEIINAFEALQGSFVKKIGDTYHFYHDLIMGVTGLVFGKDYPFQIIHYADIGFLKQKVKLSHHDTRDRFTIYLSDKYIDALGGRLFNDILGEHLLDIVLNPCLKDARVIDVFIKELERHPEKLKMLLEKKRLQIDNQEMNQPISHWFWSKLAFVSLKDKISPLCAIIIFCDTRLSLYCLKSLQQMPNYLIGNSVFSSICCNGSKYMFAMLRKHLSRESLTEKWKFFYPIHIASVFKNNEILRELLQMGADVNLKTANENYWTPLTLAAARNNTEENEETDIKKSLQLRRHDTVQLLLSNSACINLCNGDGASPLYIACEAGHEDLVKLLLYSEADINLRMKSGASPLYIACQEGHGIIVTLLLKQGAVLNLRTKDGPSPLSIACKKGYTEVVQQLVHYGANINVCNKYGASPLFQACQQGQEGIVQLLLSYGADINLSNEYKASPLLTACLHGHVSIVQLLLENGADVNLCNKYGASPLYVACKHGQNSIVQLLITYGADINLCMKNKDSPFHISCKNGYDKIVELLMSNGALINSCNENGHSPLHIACQHGHNTIVQLLLHNGVDINLCNANKVSSLDIARQRGYDDIVQLLRNHESCM